MFWDKSSIDIGMSKTLAKEFDTKKNMCHYNVWQINMIYPEFEKYLGYIKKGNTMTVHSWLVHNDKIIDPTLVLSGMFADEYLGTPNV